MKKKSTKNMIPITSAMRSWLLAAMRRCAMQQIDLRQEFKIDQWKASSICTGKAQMIQPDLWSSFVAFFEKRGAPALPAEKDSLKSKPDAETLRRTLDKLKTGTSASWKTLAVQLGLHTSTLASFMRGSSNDYATLVKIRDGIEKFERETKGSIGAMPEPTKPAKAKRKSIIEVAPPASAVALLSEAELDARTLEVLDRMRQRLHAPTTPRALLNGHAKR